MLRTRMLIVSPKVLLVELCRLYLQLIPPV